MYSDEEDRHDSDDEYDDDVLHEWFDESELITHRPRVQILLNDVPLSSSMSLLQVRVIENKCQHNQCIVCRRSLNTRLLPPIVVMVLLLRSTCIHGRMCDCSTFGLNVSNEVSIPSYRLAPSATATTVEQRSCQRASSERSTLPTESRGARAKRAVIRAVASATQVNKADKCKCAQERNIFEHTHISSILKPFTALTASISVRRDKIVEYIEPSEKVPSTVLVDDGDMPSTWPLPRAVYLDNDACTPALQLLRVLYGLSTYWLDLYKVFPCNDLFLDKLVLTGRSNHMATLIAPSTARARALIRLRQTGGEGVASTARRLLASGTSSRTALAIRTR